MESEESLTEERRQQIINQIRADAEKAGFPDYDVESRLAGHLAGLASEDRPDVPVWHYFDYAAAESAVTIEDLIDIRFPVSFYGGGSTINSVAEELKPHPIQPPVVPTAADIVRRYAMMHDAGVLGWNSATRMVERLKPLDCEMKVFKDWWNQLLDQTGDDGPRP